MNYKSADELVLVEYGKTDRNMIFEIFCVHIDSTIYVCNTDRVLKGIITPGEFKLHYMDGAYVSEVFKKIEDKNCGEAKFEAEVLFEEFKQIKQIPIIDKKGQMKGAFIREDTDKKENILDLSGKNKDLIKKYFQLYGKNSVLYYKPGSDPGLLNENDILLAQNNKLAALLQIRHSHTYSVSTVLNRAGIVFQMYRIFSNLCKRGIDCYYFGRPEIKENGQYSASAQRRMEKKLSFPVMAENLNQYQEELTGLIGEPATSEYVRDLCRIPPVIQKGPSFVHADSSSTYVNVVNGKRVTSGHPADAKFKVHIYGRCGVFGYAVEDSQTIPSFLQKELNQRKYKGMVVNHGLWGAEDDKILYNMEEDADKMAAGDVVILYIAPLNETELSYIRRTGVIYHDCTDIIYQDRSVRNSFYDAPGHMTGLGYRAVAKYFMQVIDFEKIFKSAAGEQKVQDSKTIYLEQPESSLDNAMLSDIKKYTIDIKSKYNIDLSMYKTGAIVMNANPFTLGHRYLIEQALMQVDYLIVFVVEEDRSLFKYVDRIRLVREGTKDLKNVLVEGSKQFMISSLTFPEYFLKEQQQEVSVDTSMDLEIFGKYIAPAFHIKIRFAGDEPRDSVTRKYNDSMAEILPQYGITFQVFSRIERGGDIVSASLVRRLLESKDFETIRKLVPASTYDFLLNRDKEVN